MTTVTLEVQPRLYAQLMQEAARAGRPLEALIAEWLEQRFPLPAPVGERERARDVLRAAGLLTELGPELKRRAAQATMSLEDIHAVFARAGGTPLSEMVLEQRGPKE